MRAEWTVIIGIGLAAAQVRAEERAAATPNDEVSYAMGVAVARGLQRRGLDADAEAFARGLRDALTGGKLLMSDAEMRRAMGRVAGDVNRKRSGAGEADGRKASGAAFLAENGKKEGVVTLPSGLQYRILEAGEGRVPTDAETVVCHYRGAFIDGKEFDSSYRRGKPARLELARVIPGWREALKLMPAGSKWQIFVPPELAYGVRGGGRRSRIGPNETLVFEIHLLDVEPRVAPATAGERTADATTRAEQGGEIELQRVSRANERRPILPPPRSAAPEPAGSSAGAPSAYH